MSKLKIYHNTRCSKSRCTLDILAEKKADVEVVKYLEKVLSTEEIKNILRKLGMKAHEIVRKGEKTYKEQFQGKNLSEDEWIQALHDYPILMERPIVVKGEKAVIGRPPENVLKLL